MGRRTVLEPHRIINDGDMASDIDTNTTTQTKYLDKITYEVSWTGTSPVGEIFIDRRVKNEWATLDFGSEITISGNSGSHQIEINRPADELRVRYVATSGTGTLNVWVSGTVEGA